MDQNNKKGLFQEFAPVDTQQWEDKIHEDLKGADYEKKLIWNTVEGLRIKPYYRKEDLENLSHLQVLPGQQPFVRGNHATQNNWDIRQDFEEDNPQKANQAAVNALGKGADAVGLNAENVSDAQSFDELLNNIDPSKDAVHFLHAKNYNDLAEQFLAFLDQKNIPKTKVRGSFNFDPLGYYLLYGKFYKDDAEGSFSETAKLLNTTNGELPSFLVINVNGSHFHNAGAHIVQELAFSLTQGNEYLATLTDKGLTVDEVAPRMSFTLSIGANYFLEIAKLRAMKMLWSKIVEAYKPQSGDSMKANIHARTSRWNKTVYDPYVNMLRTTTEAMAASLGGVHSLTIEPFDSTYKKPDDFSYRIARNQQIVLKHEAYFNKVADPAAGSYYIENITDSIAEAAWELFVKTENMGGFVKAVESGFVKEEIEKTCQRRDMDIAMRKRVFVGVNQYPNLEEKMLEKVKPTAQLIDLGGLRPYRGAQPFEALRLAVENHAIKGFPIPKVYLFTYGNLAMRKARAAFSTNFFGCVGYQIQEAPMIKDLDEGIEKALDAKADVVVFCSSDEEYPEMSRAATTLREKQPQTQIVVAGNPKNSIEQLNEAGVQHYIHMRTNALQTLQAFNTIFDIA